MQAARLGSAVLNDAKDFLYEQINADNKYCGSDETHKDARSPSAKLQITFFIIYAGPRLCFQIRPWYCNATLWSWEPKSRTSHGVSDIAGWWLHPLVLSSKVVFFFQSTDSIYRASHLLLNSQIFTALTCASIHSCGFTIKLEGRVDLFPYLSLQELLWVYFLVKT